MAIHPEHAERILAGEKTVEFRRTRLRAGVTTVIVYATAPTKMLLGAFEVESVDEGTPAEVWRRYRVQGGIDSQVFWSYFSSAERAFAIKVGRVFRLSQPAKLTALEHSLPVPQSYYYVGADLLEALLGEPRAHPASTRRTRAQGGALPSVHPARRRSCPR